MNEPDMEKTGLFILLLAGMQTLITRAVELRLDVNCILWGVACNFLLGPDQAAANSGGQQFYWNHQNSCIS